MAPLAEWYFYYLKGFERGVAKRAHERLEIKGPESLVVNSKPDSEQR